METKIIVGPPGSGKTSTLINIVEKELANGVTPDKIAFVSFTKKAIEEAKMRAVAKFKIKKNRFAYFKTLHALGFSELGLSLNETVTVEHLREVTRLLELPTHYDLKEEHVLLRHLFIYTVSKAINKDLRDHFESMPGASIDWVLLKYISDGFEKYKKDFGLFDFGDMITEVVHKGIHIDVDVAIIDEAQDLSYLQWVMVWQIFHGVKRLYIAGDDDQAIFGWAGADSNEFIRMEGERVQLKKSHRLPRKIFELANNISELITERRPKTWSPAREGGVVKFHENIQSVPLNKGEWLILSRNLKPLETEIQWFLASMGIPFYLNNQSYSLKTEINAIIFWERLRRDEPILLKDFNSYLSTNVDIPEKKLDRLKRGYEKKKVTWEYLKGYRAVEDRRVWFDALTDIPVEKREYYRAVLENGYKLTDPPQIKMSTIHRVKGAEIDNVLLLTDISKATERNLAINPDSEHRVFYVAITRAKRELHILTPKTRHHYNFLKK